MPLLRSQFYYVWNFDDELLKNSQLSDVGIDPEFDSRGGPAAVEMRTAGETSRVLPEDGAPLPSLNLGFRLPRQPAAAEKTRTKVSKLSDNEELPRFREVHGPSSSLSSVDYDQSSVRKQSQSTAVTSLHSISRNKREAKVERDGTVSLEAVNNRVNVLQQVESWQLRAIEAS